MNLSTLWLAGTLFSFHSASLSFSLSDKPPFYHSIVPTHALSMAEFVETKVRIRLKKYPIPEKEIRRIIIGVFANVRHESDWNPRCITGRNYGLFQLSTRGLGRGKSREWLLDYKNNATAILNCPQAVDFFDWAAGSGFDSGEFAFRFARDVERCAYQHCAPRRRTALKYQKELNL